MGDDDLELNTVRRFSKRVSNLVLEEQGHCEVPAGCGGVVLRWRNPDFGIPVTVQAHSGESHEIFLDGKSLTSARTDLTFGRHVLAMRLAYGAKAPRLMAVVSEIQSHIQSPEDLDTDRAAPWQLVSASDGTWRYAAEEPADVAWMLPGFDDTRWPQMRAVPRISGSQSEDYWIRTLGERGAEMLGPADAPNSTLSGLRTLLQKLGGPAPPQRQLCVRCAFELDRPTP